MLILSLSLFIFLSVFLFLRERKAKSLNVELQEEKSKFEAENKKLIEIAKEVEKLEKYRSIIDIEDYIQKIKLEIDEEKNHIEKKLNEATRKHTEILTEARIESGRIRNDAKIVLKEAQDSSLIQKNLVISQAKEEAKAIKEKAESVLSAADFNATGIINNAKSEAVKIAGDAYEALKKTDLLEKTAKAMKNIIDGYGDQYIVPTYSLIDHLADDYSHTQAGEELKRAREKTRLMIKNASAALCEYVEENRKQTAIDFVLDAFNGKVDTILASVKDDNFGTLEQKIKDSYQTVNYNGKAFRDARIAELYLASRLDELKWACTVQALKEKDREEQRSIREQIREEEKAVKEYERALKEAQKDEETVAKAMDKLKKEMESVSEEKRLIYEGRLHELELRLKEAEEKNKRAQSMAELTRSGHVYVISNVGSFGENVLKIGMTRRLDPLDRVSELGDASVPFKFDVHAMVYSEDAPSLEKELHRAFSEQQVNKVNARKEFFNVEIVQLKLAMEKMGIAVHWTMVAEAREYRETLSLNEKKKAA